MGARVHVSGGGDPHRPVDGGAMERRRPEEGEDLHRLASGGGGSGPIWVLTGSGGLRSSCCVDNDAGFVQVSGFVLRHEDAMGDCPRHGGGSLLLLRR